MTIDEKLALLQVLFLQRADVDYQIKELLENGGVQVPAEEDEEEPSPKRKAGKRKAHKYSKHNPMPEEVKNDIRAKFASGSSYPELVKEFGVSVSSISKVVKSVPDHMTTKHKEVKSYVCINGHEFSSKLSLLDVICPVCHSDDCDLGTLNGEVQEEQE